MSLVLIAPHILVFPHSKRLGVNTVFAESLEKFNLHPFVPILSENNLATDYLKTKAKFYLQNSSALIIPGGPNVKKPKLKLNLEGVLDEKYTKNDFNQSLRNAFEWVLLEEAIIQKKPVLGVCRGMQMINLYFGGTLYRNLDKAGFKNHGFKRENGLDVDVDSLDLTKTHGLDLKKSRMWNDPKIDLKERYTVNTGHLQGINKLGNELVATAKSPDGLVEAIEHTELPIYGVQWHPEIDSRSVLNQAFFGLVKTK